MNAREARFQKLGSCDFEFTSAVMAAWCKAVLYTRMLHAFNTRNSSHMNASARDPG